MKRHCIGTKPALENLSILFPNRHVFGSPPPTPLPQAGEGSQCRAVGNRSIWLPLAAVLAAVLAIGCPVPADALEHVVLRQNGKEISVDGRLLVEAQDGGLLLMARDGTLWTATPDELVQRTTDPAPFAPFSPDELSQRLLAELPRGFDVHRTAHYLICYDTSRVYAQWCGSLFERLYMAFTNSWQKKGFELKDPEVPLVAIVFADRGSYVKFAKGELGDAAGSIVGYFSLRTNRMTMYDLTGVESQGRFGPRGRGTNAAQINQVLSRPEAEQIVATIVHEATHQIAFNCGLHQRYSDCPVWFSEGIGTYFETPDLSSSRGWRGIGEVNRSRLAQFRKYLSSRPADSLRTLLADDRRFRDPKQALDAYAEAWSLTYYLMRQRPQQYVEYLKLLSAKGPLLEDGPETRLDEFRKVFGDLETLDVDFLRYMSRVQ